MTYSVYQHWDPLRVCIVGKSYSPEFYSFIKNTRVRTVMERIARETEEDYQKLITLLQSFGVEVLRPNVTDNYKDYLSRNNKIYPPPMTPRDWSTMVGNRFYYNWNDGLQVYNDIKADHWPNIKSLSEFQTIEEYQKQEVYEAIRSDSYLNYYDYEKIIHQIQGQGNTVISNPIRNASGIINGAQITRIGKDLYIGTAYDQNVSNAVEISKGVAQLFTDYRCHIVNTQGHSDGTFCPVVPGLIVSLVDIPTYKDTFPDWEVIYLPGQSWHKVKEFLTLKKKNKGKWWVPGEELNDEFTDFVESWLGHWVGYVEETVFDVNMLVIDEKNVVCNNYNKEVFAAFERFGITPHIVNFRHRYFWDGGLHCITSDIHREGTMKDYFPNRG